LPVSATCSTTGRPTRVFENVELNALVRLADALGYDVVVDLKKRERRVDS